MKTYISFFLILAIAVGFLAGRWSAKSISQSLNKSIAVGQTLDDDLLILFNNLQETKQTNNLNLLNDYMFESEALKDAADISITATTLRYLRDGRTNETINFLEGHLDSEIMGFAFNYHHVEKSHRDKNELKPLRYAQDYRNKFPQEDINHPEYYHDVTNAFKLLDEQSH